MSTPVALTKSEAIDIAQADWATRNAVVERIIAARLAKERERIASAIEVLECPGINPPWDMEYGFETARNVAAKVAGGDA